MDVQAEKLVTLPQAAARLRLPWNAAYTLVLKGILRGELGKNGRWQVADASIGEYENERGTTFG